MDGMAQQAGLPDPRRGVFGRVTETVYWFVVVEVAFLLAAAPGFLGVILLEQSATNIPLYALCLIPVAPAFSAALSALEARRRVAEPVVWPQFWRAYVRNVVDVLWVWVPALVAAAILGTTIAVGPAAGVDGFFIGAAVVFLVVLAVWAAHALVIASLFRFRARDTARLALYYLAAKPLVSLGALSYLVVAVALVAFVSDWALALCAVIFAAFALVNARPLIASVRDRFIAPEPESAPETD